MLRDPNWLVSPEDEELFDLFPNSWSVDGGYLRRNRRKGEINHPCNIRFHREVARRMGLDLTVGEVDHINQNKLDNRRNNLRLVTFNQNRHNCKAPKNNTSGYCGVTWHKLNGKWQSQVMVNNKNKYIGSFSDPLEAAIAYDKAALHHHKEFACTNFCWRIYPQWKDS